MAHELGHILGLTHEHNRTEHATFSAENGSLCTRDGAVALASLTVYDTGSVMQYLECNGAAWRSLTELDRTGIAALYGHPQVNKPPVLWLFSQSTTNLTVGATYRFNAVDANLRNVTVNVNDQPWTTLTAPPWEFTVATWSLGVYPVQIIARDTAGLTTEALMEFTIGGATTKTSPQLVEAPADASEGGCRSAPSSIPWTLLGLLVRRKRRGVAWDYRRGRHSQAVAR